MKKFIALILVLICISGFSACGKNVEGNVENVKITDFHSEVYTDKEIEDALNVTFDYFKNVFSGCTLTEITYVGDSKLDFYQDFAETHHADDVIVFTSTFYVDSSCGDESLVADSTYEKWCWILVRNNGCMWRHVDHGY